MIMASAILTRLPISLDITSQINALQVAYDLKHESWLDSDINNVSNVLSSPFVGPVVL